MDAIQFLKGEHRTAEAAFARIEGASKQERGGLWRALRPELEIHEQIEEEALYEPLGEEAQERDPILSRWDEEHVREVEEAQGLMDQIDAADAQDDGWLARLAALKAALQRHIEREEQQIFPRIGLVWNRDRIDRAGGDLERLKGERMRRAA